MVVPSQNLLQGFRHLSLVRDGFPRQFPIDRSDESFNSPILPRAAGLDALLSDAQCPEANPEESRDQHRFVVRSEELWSTILFH